MVVITIGEALLIVELILLIFTIYLIYTSRIEIRKRSELIDSLIRATRIFSRAEYFMIVQEAIGEATSYIYASVTGTRPSDEERDTIERLLSQLERAARMGVKLRFILPKDPSRLYMGYRYKRIGAEVKYSPSLLVSELRYMIVDGTTIVLGFPERRGVGEPTRRGQRIYSEGFALLLKERFESVWNSPQSVDYDEYLSQVIRELKNEAPGASDEYISSVLKLPVEEIRQHSATIVK